MSTKIKLIDIEKCPYWDSDNACWNCPRFDKEKGRKEICPFHKNQTFESQKKALWLLEKIDNLIQRFSSIGYSIINKIKSFQEDFDIDIFQSSIELSIDDLQQLLRFVKKTRLNSEFGKLASTLKGEK